MQNILVSACLVGNKVRYDGKALPIDSEILKHWQTEERIVAFCPEVSGGLPIPRIPAEIVGGDGDAVLSGKAAVTAKNGKNVTVNFVKGAQLALSICKEKNIKMAILSEASPSCGGSMIYNGTFSNIKVPGVGVTTALLRKHGISVFSQYEINAVYEYLAEVND